MNWYTYILRCSNGSFYVGHTNSVENRFARHLQKSGARHTASYEPERIEYTEEFDSEKEAIRRERQIKKWTRAKKTALINKDFEQLKALSKSSFNRAFQALAN
ncbi:MAG: GIY-YIG nuclease family protein [Kiritimatiellae bacterium]|nr:GIY-YIG nuclease family protein [Kiritimatiellia bacterium]